MRFPTFLQRLARAPRESVANDTANEPANAGANGSQAPPPPDRAAAPRTVRRQGWRTRRREAQLAVRRTYARLRTAPTSLSRSAEVVVGCISVIAYAISYASLYGLATHHNFGGPGMWESIAWPTTVDLASLSMGIIGLDRAHRGQSAWLAGTISAIAAGVMVAGNLLANQGDPITVGMHAWPPVIALACWYALVRGRRDDARARGLLGEGADSQPEPPADSHDDDPDDSQPPPPDRPASRSQPDPRIVRIARNGGDWRAVAAATGLGKYAAQRALTAARKRIRTGGLRARRAA